MTAEFNPIPEAEPRRRNFLELPDDTLELINRVGNQVAVARSATEAHHHTELLNEVFHADELLGRTAILSGEYATMISRDVVITDKKVDFSEPSATTYLDERQFEGIFTGCSAHKLDEHLFELTYQLEMPIDSGVLAARSVIACFSDARLRVEVNLPDVKQHNRARFDETLGVLAEIDDEVILDRAQQIREIVTSGDMIDAEMLNTIAFLVEEIFEHPATINSPPIYTAVLQLIMPLFDEQINCSLQGVELFFEKSEEDQKTWSSAEIKARGAIHGLRPVPNIEIENEGSEVPDNMQAAFVFLDTNGVERLYPLKHLSYFSFIDEPDAINQSQEDVWRERFLKKYPKLFKK